MMIVPRKSNAGWKNPFYELDKFQRDLNRFFDLGQGMADQDASLLAGYWTPAVEVLDHKDNVIVRAELPGLVKEDIEVTIENNVLSIRGEKKQEHEQKEAEVVRSERYYGVFHRAFTLPSSVDSARVNAKFHNGVLELTIAKKEDAKPRQIRVEVK
jgi:HSP20 family protein